MRTSKKLLGYDGPNPFLDVQAKAARSGHLTKEFYPLPLYWSLFNDTHEILLGTRGSGKTIILRMMSYSFLRQFNHPRAREIIKGRNYFGFYVPLHLEFMTSLQGKDVNSANKLEYFQFAFNCLAATSYLQEIAVILEDLVSDISKRLVVEANLAADLHRLWFGEPRDRPVSSIDDLLFEITVLWEKTSFWQDGHSTGAIPLARPILDPILTSAMRVAKHLGLDLQDTTWIACLDEAEFLRPEYWTCINNFIRSEKRPVVIKLATLPFRHDTRDTLEHDVRVEPDNDYRYQLVDTPCESEEFRSLCDHILTTRLRRCDVWNDPETLEQFVGKVGQDDGYDYFMAEMSKKYASKDELLNAILNSLSSSRRHKYEEIRSDPDLVEHWYWKRFRPVYYLRALKQEDSHGNRQVGWFAGADTIRKISDGNPRRFLQIMGELFELARSNELTPKNQHRLLYDFAERHYESAAALPSFGFLLHGLLNKIGMFLAERVHGGVMVDGGCHFRIDESLFKESLIINAVHLGIAYSLIFCDHDTMTAGISRETDFRLAYLCAVHFWLPMRKGDPVMLRSKRIEQLFGTEVGVTPPLDKSVAQRFLGQMNLEYLEENSES